MTGGARGELLESGVVSPLATLAVGGTTDGCSKDWVMLGNIPGSPAEGEPEGSTPGDILFIIGGGGKLSIPADTFGELWPEFSSSSSLNRTVKKVSKSRLKKCLERLAIWTEKNSQLGLQITFT